MKRIAPISQMRSMPTFADTRSQSRPVQYLSPTTGHTYATSLRYFLNGRGIDGRE